MMMGRMAISLHSLKRMAPVERTKKKVPIMVEMMVVKLSTMTICVVVILVHQGAVSCKQPQRGQGGGRRVGGRQSRGGGHLPGGSGTSR